MLDRKIRHGTVLTPAQQSCQCADTSPPMLCSVGLKNELDQVSELVAEFDFEINES